MLFAFYYTFLDLLLSSNYSVFGSCSFEVILWRLLLVYVMTELPPSVISKDARINYYET